MNWLKESRTKRGRQSGREAKERREGGQGEGLRKRRGKREGDFDFGCVLRFFKFECE